MVSSGIYSIRHIKSGRVYVGSSKDIAVRWRCHRSELRNGKHPSVYLQRSWKRNGADAFTFEVLETCEVSALAEREQYWMDRLRACDHKFGYNLFPIARSASGYSHTTQSIENFKAGARRRWGPKKEKQLLSKEEVSRRRAEGLKRHWSDPVKKARHSLANKKGWTEERRIKASERAKAQWASGNLRRT
jgi:group I intron endonuclease